MWVRTVRMSRIASSLTPRQSHLLRELQLRFLRVMARETPLPLQAGIRYRQSGSGGLQTHHDRPVSS
ncbi:unnamed protein product [Closterium sp. NIES-53]